MMEFEYFSVSKDEKQRIEAMVNKLKFEDVDEKCVVIINFLHNYFFFSKNKTRLIFFTHDFSISLCQISYIIQKKHEHSNKMYHNPRMIKI